MVEVFNFEVKKERNILKNMKANIPKTDWLVKGISTEQLKKERDFCCVCKNSPFNTKRYHKAKRFCKKCDPYDQAKSRFKKIEFEETERNDESKNPENP